MWERSVLDDVFLASLFEVQLSDVNVVASRKNSRDSKLCILLYTECLEFFPRKDKVDNWQLHNQKWRKRVAKKLAWYMKICHMLRKQMAWHASYGFQGLKSTFQTGANPRTKEEAKCLRRLDAIVAWKALKPVPCLIRVILFLTPHV